jgi:hypothetical protein
MTESARHIFSFSPEVFSRLLCTYYLKILLTFSLYICATYPSVLANIMTIKRSFSLYNHLPEFFIRLCYIYLLSEDTTYWWFCIRDVHSVLANVMTIIRHSFFFCIIVCLEFSADCHIYLWWKVVCWFCLFACLPHWDLSNYGASCHTLGTIGKPSMSRGALSWFHNGLTYGGEVIEYWIIFIENSFKSKLKFIGEFGCPLDIVGKPSVSKI